MVFRQKQGHSFKVRVAHAGKSATLSCGTPDGFTALQVEHFVKTMKARRRWDVIDALTDKRVSLPAAYDAYEMGTLDQLLKELSSPDLDPLVTEWSKTANAKYVKQVRRFIPANASFRASAFTRRTISLFLAGLEVSGSTRLRYRAAISVFARWLIEREVLDHNPVRDVAGGKPNKARDLYHYAIPS